MAREINLVPDIKADTIKAIKIRNYTFFASIVIGIASVAAILVFASIAGGQQAIVDGKKNTINSLSTKISQYSDLDEFLVVKDQLSNLSAISNNKKLLSRTFNVLSALIPTGADSIIISALSINLESDSPTISFDAQANAGSPPYIDYNVLDSFRKSMPYMRYDYGNYVDKNGTKIPAYCIIETGIDGATFFDQDKSSYYAYWLITGEGCNPSYQSDLENDNNDDTMTDEEIQQVTDGYTTETYNGQTVVKIWRTPQFTEWHQNNYMDLNGTISGVAHFESKCTTYSGVENTDNLTGQTTISWASFNESCLLVDKISIPPGSSSNGRGASGDLVLRFSATITINSEVFKFSNDHVLAIGPTNRYNVTDSYVQIQNIFGERAADCEDGDTACKNSNNGDNQNG